MVGIRSHKEKVYEMYEMNTFKKSTFKNKVPGCQNRGIGRAVFVLFPGAGGVGALPEGSARKSSFLPEKLGSRSVVLP